MFLANNITLHGTLIGLWLATWLVSELSFITYALARRSSTSPGRGGDRGSGLLIFLSIGVAIGVNLGAARSGLGPMLSLWALVPGSVLLALGIGIRGWAILTLGREFSLVVRTTEDQKLIERGPYAFVRHPAYTGSLLTVLGFAFFVGNAVGIAVTLVVVVPAFLYRIGVEETALRLRFPLEYQRYTERTWRLLPGVY